MNIKELKIPFALRGNLHIVNKSDGPRIIAGYANVAVVDSEEQFIPIETLEKGIICLLQDPHYANLMLVHQNIQIGKIIEKFGEHTTHVDEKGLFIVCLTPDTEIRTSKGLVPISDVNIGDKVLTHLGGYSYPVTSTMKRWFNGNIKKIYLSNREEIKITGNHPLLTKDGWKRADELVKGDILLKLSDTFENHNEWLKKLQEHAKSTILTKESKKKAKESKRNYNFKRPYYVSDDYKQFKSKYAKDTSDKYCTGKSYEELYGKEIAEEIKKKQRRLKINVSNRRKNLNREEILQFTNYTCQKCNTNYEHYPRYLLIHHKDNNPNNDISENLEVLCYKCHAKTYEHTAFTGIGANSNQEWIRNYHKSLIKSINKCQMCNSKENLVIHHIADSEETKDLMVLCRSCHSKIHHNPDLLVMNGTTVRWIEDEPYEGYVYNLEVENANSYAGKGLIYHNCEIRKDLQSANEIWEAILNNEINGFSIGCEVLNSHKSCDDTKCITILDKINIFEVSVCSRPVNEESGFIVISKSKFGNVCEECNLRKDENMSEKVEAKEEETKKEKKTEENKAEVPAQTQEKKVEEVKKDIPVPPQVDKMAELERKINALETLIQESKKASEPLSEEDPKIEDMAIFMLDYIIRNPKSSSQDIAKAWIKTKKAPKEKKPVEEPMPEEPMPEEPIPPEEEKPIPLPFSKMNETIDKLSAIVDKLTKLSAEEELKMSIKSRDDQILALQTQIKTLSKPEEKKVDEGLPKTIQPVEQHELEKDNPIRIEHGIVYFKD